MYARFDFGVPLEDVFPKNNVHPRLMYLFNTAIQSYQDFGCDITELLSFEQISFDECFSLKEKLVLSIKYAIKPHQYAPGTYFWLIRHFLGLLPLPLFPQYTNGVYFDWISMANRCEKVIRNFYDYSREKKALLQHEIAETINMLPAENVILINILMRFMRRVTSRRSATSYKFDGKALGAAIDFYCASLFIRPYVPGLKEKTSFHPLLLYCVIYWHKITKNCNSIGHPTTFRSTTSTFFQMQNPEFLSPDIITLYKNVPCMVNYVNKYLKDSESQTDVEDFREDLWINKLPDIEEENEGLDSFFDNNNTLYQTAKDFSFKSIVEEEDGQNWRDIVKETEETVKKVEGSCYGDEARRKEEERSEDSFFCKLDQVNTRYASIRKPTTKVQCSTPNKNSPDSDNSYVKYPDVCTSSSESQSCVFESYNSETHVSQESEPKEDEVPEKKCVAKKPRLLARIRLSLEFFKAMTPKMSGFKKFARRHRYRRLGKFNTI